MSFDVGEQVTTERGPGRVVHVGLERPLFGAMRGVRRRTVVVVELKDGQRCFFYADKVRPR